MATFFIAAIAILGVPFLLFCLWHLLRDMKHGRRALLNLSAFTSLIDSVNRLRTKKPAEGRNPVKIKTITRQETIQCKLPRFFNSSVSQLRGQADGQAQSSASVRRVDIG